MPENNHITYCPVCCRADVPVHKTADGKWWYKPHRRPNPRTGDITKNSRWCAASHRYCPQRICEELDRMMTGEIPADLQLAPNQSLPEPNQNVLNQT